MKSAPEASRLDLLTTCVAMHPDNRDGVTDPPEYRKYLPDPSKAEERVYRKHLVQRCIENLGDTKAACEKVCACKSKPADKEEKAACKQTCRECKSEKAQRVRECKKSGGVVPASAPPAKAAPDRQPEKGSRKGGPGREPKPADSGSELKPTVL